jgi:cytidyltransferase-like protein
MQKIVLVTGGFDPLHSGHLAYFTAARELGTRLVVGVNSDAWLKRKKGQAFMPLRERTSIIENLRMVDECIQYDDSSGHSKEAIRLVRKRYPTAEIIFANGGDRTDENIPEMDIDDDNVKFSFGVGGFNKSNSSSWILEEWKAPKTIRPWGYYRVLHETADVKVKELTVDPGAALSMQRHNGRSEFWLVSSGVATLNTLDQSTDVDTVGQFTKHQCLHIAPNEWHQLVNEDPSPLKIVEIQYGDRCEETDIERRL